MQLEFYLQLTQFIAMSTWLWFPHGHESATRLLSYANKHELSLLLHEKDTHPGVAVHVGLETC